MKKTVTLAVIFSAVLFAQWENINPNPQGKAINSICYLDSLSIWVAGDNGIVMHSTNSGHSWTGYSSVTSQNVNAIDFFDSSNGFMVGDNGTIFLTYDSGVNWVPANFSTSLDLNDAIWIDNNSILAAGEDGVIVKGDFTQNTWVEYPGQNYNRINDIYMMCDSIWTVGNQGEFQISVDSGVTWTKLPDIKNEFSSEDVNSFTVYHDRYYATAGWVYYLSVDHGATWFNIPTNDNEYFEKAFSTDSTFWAIGYDIDFGSLIKRNGVKDYSAKPLSTLRSIDFIDEAKGISAGTYGAIITTGNNGSKWSTVFSGISFDVKSVDFPSPETGYAAAYMPGYSSNAQNVIFKTTDGGISWFDINSGYNFDVPDWIGFFNDSVGLYRRNEIYFKTIDGGKTWNEVLSQDTYFGGCDIIDSVNAYAVSGTKLYYSTDAGSSWDEYSISGYETSEFYDVDFIDYNNGFAVGDSAGSALLMRTTDGGISWENKIKKSDNLNKVLTSVCALSQASVNVLSEDGYSLNSHNMFESYSLILVDGINTLNSIAFKNALNGTIAGDNGSLYFTTNGGNSWASYNTGYSDKFYSVMYSGEGTGWIAGSSGVLLKSDEDSPPLPVELLAFNVRFSDDKNIIEWSTATETNSYGFEIEKKTSGGSWEKIGFVNSGGNSSSIRKYSFSDAQIDKPVNYYRLKQVDIDGEYSYTNAVSIENNFLLSYSLAQNYPNPFNPSTNIEFSLPERSKVVLTVYNLIGEEVTKLENDILEPGKYSYRFNASNLSSGVYFYRLATAKYEKTRKMLLLK